VELVIKTWSYNSRNQAVELVIKTWSYNSRNQAVELVIKPGVTTPEIKIRQWS
jgi:hypothetical protein